MARDTTVNHDRRVLTYEEIEGALSAIAPHHDIARVSCFGSYAENRATSASDLDLLIVFNNKEAKSLLDLIAFQLEVEDTLGLSVDVLHAPLPDNTLLKITREVLLYEQP